MCEANLPNSWIYHINNFIKNYLKTKNKISQFNGLNHMLEFKFFRKLKNEPYSEYKTVQQITLLDMKTMYGIFEKYYLNTTFKLFEKDMLDKTGVFVIRDPKSNVIVGFSTVTERNFTVNNKVHHAFFSGDTVIEQAYWGSRALQRAMFRYTISFKFKYPTQPIYWMLISKGFKTYLLLANNYFTYYPHCDQKHQRLEPHVKAYCEQYFLNYFDKEKGLLDFGDDYQPLKPDIAPITDEMREKNKKIAFFEQKNPSWGAGTELPCIGELHWTDLYRYLHRFLSKPSSQGQRDRELADCGSEDESKAA